MSEVRARCFVIMPFSKSSDSHTEEYWTNHFTNFLKPLIEEIPNLEASRVKSLRGHILNQIITDLVVSPIVVAELTDHNPNVFWELGVRQSFKHNTITIAEQGTTLPFDVSSKATLFYDPKDHLKMEAFRKQFKEALEDCKASPDKSDSHVLDTISGRGSFYEILRLDEAIRRIEALISECERNISLFKFIIPLVKGIKRGFDRNDKIVLDYINDKKLFVITSYQSSAIKHLVISRYLDEDKSFYISAETYLNRIYTLNNLSKSLYTGNLDNWKQFVEIWFIKKQKKYEKTPTVLDTTKLFDSFIKKLKDVHKSLKEKFQLFKSEF